jgi:hypothetical protein
MAAEKGTRVIRITILDVYPTQLGHCPHYNLISSQMMAAGSEFCELSSQALEYPDEVLSSHSRREGAAQQPAALKSRSPGDLPPAN